MNPTTAPRTERLLVVDDDISITEMLHRALTAQGYEVDVAFDGDEAYQIAVQRAPALVLLDLMMPKSDGYAFLERRAEDATLRDTPVVVLTAHGDEQEIIKAITAGADDFLQKPISMLELTMRLHARLRDRDTVNDLRGQRRDQEMLLDLSTALASKLEVREILFLVATRLAQLIDVERVSFLVVTPDLELGYVLAASEDKAVHDLRVHLAAYPEVIAVMKSGAPLFIPDVASHPLLTSVQDQLRRTDIRGVTLFPLASGDDVLGVLVLRTRMLRPEPSKRENHICRIVANVTAAALESSPVVRAIRSGSAPDGMGRHDELAQMRKTKEFLEQIVQQSVEVIIAADAGGVIILWNEAAEKLFGYTFEEAASLRLSELFPPGELSALLSLMRSPEVGGEGRLSPVRREIVRRGGDTAPVRMSAAILRDAGAEVAMFAVLSDLRQEEDLASRLSVAQAPYSHSDRQVIAAEIAGTTAHEINQPLTSLLGLAELVRRGLGPSSPLIPAAQGLVREAERIAEVVRKLGRIHRYESKPYVGATQIADLDRSSAEVDEET